MTQRLAATASLVVFIVCLLSGIAAENTFGTVVSRALLAMLGSLVIGLVLGAMAQRMIKENLNTELKKIEKDATDPGGNGR